MRKNELVDQILSYKRYCKSKSELIYIESILLTHLDNIKGAKDSNSRALLTIFHVVYFPISFCIIFFVFIEGTFRLLFKKTNGNCNPNILVTFGNSHTAVLKRIPYEFDSRREYSFVSSRTFRESIERKSNDDTFYIDSYNSFSLCFFVLFKQIKLLFAIKAELFILIDFFGLSVGFKKFVSLIFCICQSIRFRFWVEKFNQDVEKEIIFLGNDTCYRTFWIITSNRNTTSITIQHGIIENKLMYFSIANYFLCWDANSFDRLWKNTETNYLIVGYPKIPLSQTQERVISSSIGIIVTKLYSRSNAGLLVDNLKQLNRLCKDVIIKLHPLEEKNVVDYIKSEFSITNQNVVWDNCKYVIVVDSTFAVDLNIMGKSVVPITIQGEGPFSLYYSPVLLVEFTKILESCDESGLETLLERLSQKANIKADINLVELQKVTGIQFDVQKIN